MTDAVDVHSMYKTGSWNGIQQFQCLLCPFDVLKSEEKMVQHIEQRHLETPETVINNPQQRIILVADKRGNELR